MASPAALSLITLLFPGKEERVKAIGIWGGMAALGGTMGFVISGVLTDLTSWRWVFLINLPVAALALILLPRLIPESRAAARTRLDVPGAVLGTGAAVSLVWGLLRVGEANWTDSAAVGSLLLAVVLTIAFLVVESRTVAPLVPLSFFALPTRAVANIATLLFSVAFYAMAFLLMIHLQTVLGYGPLEAGIAYLPYCAGILLGMWLSTRMAITVGARWTLTASFLTSAAGLLMLSGVAPGDGYASAVLPGMLVTSLGCGLTLPTLSVTALTGTTEEDAGLGSAIFSSVQQVGGAVGVAVLVSLAAWRGEGLTGSVEPLLAKTAGFSFALTVAAVILMLGAAGIAIFLRRPPNTDAKSSEIPGRAGARGAEG
ncbi:DHA2 family efflux MFS transporter permease subunit [Glycomyces albus]